MTETLSGPMLPPKSGGAAKQLMVLLHGYGANGADLLALGYQWRELFPDMLFVSPDAPHPCGLGQGYEWFPVDYERRAEAWRLGPQLAAPVLINFLMDLWAQTGVKPGRTILTGFSQGAMMALHVGTALDQPVAGIIAFSGAFAPAAGFGASVRPKPPVAIIHGDEDNVVPVDLGRLAAKDLTAVGFDVSLYISPGAGHGIGPDGLDFATSFLLAQMANNP
ncbi:MAG TPA: dienelactone hydrolase family protein [Devosia sp.]|nr:dienelactone hydrolase family protein [Devosia sp.]